MMDSITSNNRLSPEEYINKAVNLVYDYVTGVFDGKIKVNKEIKLQVALFKKWKHEDKYDFRPAEVERVFRFFSYLNIEDNNKYEQFPLLDWQAFTLALIFGFYHKNTDFRKHREILLNIGKGNGKTPFAVAITLFGLTKDKILNPDIIFLAITTTQTRDVALKYAKIMIYHSPSLRCRLQINVNKIQPLDEIDQGKMKVISSMEPDRFEGYKLSMAIIDEIHGFDKNKVEDVYNIVKGNIGKRENSLLLLTTTVGTKDNPFFLDHIEYCKRMLRGEIEDERKCALIFCPDDEDNLSSEETWFKANPSMYAFPTLYKDLHNLHLEAKNSPTSRLINQFKSKRLNLFVDAIDEWIYKDKLYPCFVPMKLEDFKGQDCFWGLDLAATKDLAALSLVFGEEEDMKVFVKYYIGGITDKLLRRDKTDLTDWIRRGFIHRSKEDDVDFEQIVADIIEIHQNFNMISGGYDIYNAPPLISRVQKILGEDFYAVPLPQNFGTFNLPCRTMERLVSSKKIKFQENPVLKWNFANIAILEQEEYENIRPSKKKSKEKIDGVVATLMAMNRMLHYLNPILVASETTGVISWR